MILQLLCTFSALVTFGQNCGDINGDSSTNIVDALLLAQCYVGLISTLNCCDIPTETPTPTPETETYELQAETEATWDNAAVESNHTGYTGSGYVNTANSSGSPTDQ